MYLHLDSIMDTRREPESDNDRRRRLLSRSGCAHDAVGGIGIHADCYAQTL
jgi:hypothetical protein